MNTIDCHSIRYHRDVDFHQLSMVVRNSREYLNSFKTTDGQIAIHAFEVPEQLTKPLQNLDDLLTTLFKETETAASEKQKKYLVTCEKLVAGCYCYIQQFIELNAGKSKSGTVAGTSEHTRELAYEFYYNAPYELRTPVSALKGYSEPQIRTLMGVDVPPFIPENQDKFDQIHDWIDELWKFMEDLPKLWQVNKQEDSG
jgi:hypothetical protein